MNITKKFNDFNELYFHKYINHKLKNIKLNMSMGFLGHKGSGKLTRIYMILSNSLDDNVYNIKKNKIILNNNNIKFDFEYLLSQHHIDIDISNYKYKKIIFKQFLEEYIQSINIYTQSKKIVIIRNIHKLDINILKYISLLIDKYFETSIFILVGLKINYYNLLNKLFIIKLKDIPKYDMIQFIKSKYNTITDKQISIVLNKSKEFDRIHNLNNILHLLEMNYISGTFTDFTNSIQKIVDDIFFIIHSPDYKFTDMIKIKEVLYKLFSYNFNIVDILKYSINKIIDKYSNNIKYNDLLYKIIKIGSELEHKMVKSKKEIMYLEQFYVEYICLYKKNKK